MHVVQEWLATLPPLMICLVVGLVIAAESTGIPLPGEIVLVSATLLSAAGVVPPWQVALAGSAGAVIGDSLGYAIGRRGGRQLLERLGRRFPRHFGPAQLAQGERAFDRWGVAAVFGARFVALLRILAGPMAGALRVPYPKFLLANMAGGIAWATGTTFALYSLGQAADRWLNGFSWLALLVAVLFGVVTTLVLRQRARRLGGGSPAVAQPAPVEAAPGVRADAG